jgi:hypothetical protein
VQINTTLLTGLPLHRYRGIDIRLMYNLRNQLRSITYHVGSRGWNFRARNGIRGTVFEEQPDEGAEGVEEEADYDQVDDEEDDGSAPHRGYCIRGLELKGYRGVRA